MSKYRKNCRVLTSMCGRDGKMTIPQIFSAFMDIATEHAEILGIGYTELTPRHLFWITSKSRVHLIRAPRLLEEIVIETWPETPGALRCNRDYRILSGEDVLAEGKTEWTVFDLAASRVVPTAEFYPKGFETIEETVLPEGFDRIRDTFTDTEPFASYRVRSVDIDLGGHMNNVAYISAMAGCFSAEEWSRLRIRDVEVIYRAQTFENETLYFYRSEQEGVIDIKAAKEDGTAAALFRISGASGEASE